MIYKLSYINKDEAINDLNTKGILTEEGFGIGVLAVVEIGLIVLDIVDEQPVYANGYHYDILTENTYDFGANEVKPRNPKHQFAGYPITDEVTQ